MERCRQSPNRSRLYGRRSHPRACARACMPNPAPGLGGSGPRARCTARRINRRPRVAADETQVRPGGWIGEYGRGLTDAPSRHMARHETDVCQALCTVQGVGALLHLRSQVDAEEASGSPMSLPTRTAFRNLRPEHERVGEARGRYGPASRRGDLRCSQAPRCRFEIRQCEGPSCFAPVLRCGLDDWPCATAPDRLPARLMPCPCV